MAVGGVLAFGVQAPAGVEKYVDLLDLGLILVWAGVLLLVMQVVMHRPRRPRRPRRSAYDDRTDQWYANDVHRPGYAGQTRTCPPSAAAAPLSRPDWPGDEPTAAGPRSTSTAGTPTWTAARSRTRSSSATWGCRRTCCRPAW